MDPYDDSLGAENASNAAEPFVSDEDLAALRDEALIMGDVDEKTTAERLFRDNLPLAALSIVELARNASSDRTRLDAAKYIVERNLGRIQDLNISDDDPLMTLVKELAVNANQRS